MNTETILSYTSPAENFNQALPVGNGRIGGMIFGDAADELIKLNEDSVWSGGLRHRINPSPRAGYQKQKRLLLRKCRAFPRECATICLSVISI